MPDPIKESPLFRVAIVGSGPSGFYAAEGLLNSSQNIEVDMYDALPFPFGLVRFGVAPDHQKIKSVVKIYEKIAANEHFNFFGNVLVGRDIGVKELKDCYDAVIFACGAQTDRKLDIPGENLPGSYTATEFVAWYNGHPDYQNHHFDLSHEVAVIIGQGNVAIDVGRILAKTTDELKSTDITQSALDVLAQSRVKEIHLIGRRGPVQAAFSPLEIRELGELKECDCVIDPGALKLNPESETELKDPAFPLRKKNFGILTELAAKPLSSKGRKVFLHFHQSPKELTGKKRLEKVVLERNKLVGPAGHQRAEGLNTFEEISCGILFRSVGYSGVAIADVPFDPQKAVFPNVAGRLTDQGKIVPGFYAVGWIKRGPTGIIGTNKPDSIETVKNVLLDFAQLSSPQKPGSGSVRNILKDRKVRVISFQDWKKIDAAEIARGKPVGKPREKFTSFQDILSVIPS